jgi:hypothetical protein
MSNEQQKPEMTAMQEMQIEIDKLLSKFEDESRRISTTDISTVLNRLRSLQEYSKELRDTVERDQLVEAYNYSWKDMPCTFHTGEQWYKKKYNSHE